MMNMINRLLKLVALSLVVVLLATSCTKKKKEEKMGEVINLDKVDPFSEKGILSLMELTSQWQIDNLEHVMVLPNGTIEPLTTHNWVRATFLSGMMAYYDVTADEDIFNFVYNLAEEVDFKLGERPRHADEFAIGRVYTDLYLKTRNDTILADMINRIDGIIEDPRRGPEFGWDGENNWSWCDALFMAPPAWLKLYTSTGKRKYLHEMDIRFWDTYDHLYSKEDSLFYRDARFIWDKDGNGLKTENGKKIFWGRGNGWVVGGLTDILTYLPGDYHHRSRYKQLFEEMIEKIASLQGDDGMWRASLLDYEQYPEKEFSASAFFTYAMAWGINHKILDHDTYWPHIEKAWEGLVACIQPDGKIGYVQRVGADPASVKAEDTMEYGTGAFLLCSKEMFEIIERENSSKN